MLRSLIPTTSALIFFLSLSVQLMFAARYGHSTVVEYLLSEAKVDPMTLNKDKKTAADLAEFWGSTEALAVFERLAPKSRTTVRTLVSSGSPFSSTAASGMAAASGVVSDVPKSSSTMADWWKRRTIQENKPLHFTGGIHNRYDVWHHCVYRITPRAGWRLECKSSTHPCFL